MNAAFLRIGSVASVALLLAACGGGGSSTTPATPAVIPVATPAVGATSTPSPSTTPAGVTSSTLTLDLPSRAAYAGGPTVAPETTAVIAYTGLNGVNSFPTSISTNTVDTLTLGGNCSADGTFCKIQIPTIAGAVALTVTTYAGANVLATGSTTLQLNGTASQTNSLTLGAVISSIRPLSLPQLTVGQASTTVVPIVAVDASNAQITGTIPFANPLTLTDNDQSGATKLAISDTSQTSGASVVVHAPSDVVSIVYNGANFASSISINAQPSSATIASQSSKRTTFAP